MSNELIFAPPNAGTLKINFDGVVFEDLGVVGIGIVVRNSFSEVMVALSEIIPMPSSIVALETIESHKII